MNPIPPVLPQDVLLEIFSHLPITAIPSIGRTSKLWNRVVNNEQTWKSRVASFVSKEFSPPSGFSYKEAYKELREIIREYPIELIVALGSPEKILKLPLISASSPQKILKTTLTVAYPLKLELTSYCMPSLNLEEICAPIMRGKAENGEHFCTFKLKEKTTEKPILLCLFQTSLHSTVWSRQESDKSVSDFRVRTCQKEDFKLVKQIRNGKDHHFQF